ncbi:MAG: hypothetical protein MK212_13230 [Saprospiraceae bacterium]|nr:hypothetical protein [Saprospiraceae bacterium]
MKIQILIIFAIFMLFSCHSQGDKGAWSAKFKEDYQKRCEHSVQMIDNGLNAPKICACVMNQLEKNYAPNELNKAQKLLAEEMKKCIK